MVTAQSACAETDATALWEQYRADPQGPALGALVEFYLELAADVVQKLSIRVLRHVDRKELLSVGVIGLHAAIRSYESTKGNFDTYARRRIKGAIIDELRQLDHLTRKQRQGYRCVCSAINTLTGRFSRTPSMEEIAGECEMSVEDVQMYLGMGSNAVNLNDEFRNGITYLDMLADSSESSPVEQADRSIAIEQLRHALRSLDERQQQLIFLRHHEGMRVKEIAQILKISEGRISQIYKEAIIRLRALMKISITNRN